MDSDSDYESDAMSLASGPPPSESHYSMASSQTSYEFDPSIRSQSPSVLSMTSSLQANMYRQEYGRGLNNYSDLYRLPADDEELQRLDRQHSIFIDLMGEKYVPVMAEVMAEDDSGETKACLDLGCGSGSWIMEVARDFPHCSAVAVDLIPMQHPSVFPPVRDHATSFSEQLDWCRDMPANLRSEVDDVNLGLEHFYGDFNVVHVRLISSGIRDYHRLLEQISRVLRPGGLIDVSEFDFYTYDKHHNRVELGTHEIAPPWLSRWMAFIRIAIKHIGGHTEAATHLHEWITSNPLFEDIVYREFWLPVVAPPPHHSDSEATRRFYAKMRENITAFLASGRPLLLGSGLTDEIVNELEQGATAEILARKEPFYTRLQCVYARRKARR